MCKFLFAGGGTSSDAVLCLDYLRANGVVITNNSWGGGGYTLALLEAIRRVCTAGGLFVAAAGNEGVNIAGGSFPAAYVKYSGAGCVLPVAATGSSNTLASFSNWGTDVPIAAPGVNIRSSVYDRKVKNREATWSGTSMAAPHVTGVALFIKNALPALNGTMIKKAFVESATVGIKPYGTNMISGKLLDAEAAYELAATMM
jgi:subtilisin family serine protease